MYFESPPAFRGLQRVSDNDARSSDAFMHNLGLLDQENDTAPVGRVTCVRDSTLCDNTPTPLSTTTARSTLGLLPENQTWAKSKGVVVAEDESPVLIRRSMSFAEDDDGDLAPAPPVTAGSEIPTKVDGDTPPKGRSNTPTDDVEGGDDSQGEDDDHDLLFPREEGIPVHVELVNADDQEDSEASEEVDEGHSRSVRITNLRRPTEMVRRMTEGGVDTAVLAFGRTPLALLKLGCGKATIDVPIGAAFSSWNECAEMANILRRVGAVLEEALTHRPSDREMRAYDRAKSDYEAASTDVTIDTPPTEAPALLGGGMLWEDFAASQHQAEDSDESDSTSESVVESSSDSFADSEDESYDDGEEDDEEEEEERDTASPPRTKWRREVTVPATDKGSPGPNRAAPKTKRPRKVDPMPIPALDALPTMLRTLLVNCKLFPLPQEVALDHLDAVRSGLVGWTVHALKACCRDWGVSKGVLAKGKNCLVNRLLAAITAVTTGSWPVEEEVEVSQLLCVNTDPTDNVDATEKEADTNGHDTEVAELSTVLENGEDARDTMADNVVTGNTEHNEEEAADEQDAKVDVFMGDSDDESVSPQRNDSRCKSGDDEAFSSCQSTSDSDEVI